MLVSVCTSSFLCNSKLSYQVHFQCTAPWWHMEHLQRSSIRCRTAYSVHTGRLHSVVCGWFVSGCHILNCTWSIGWLAVQCYFGVRAPCLFGRVVCVAISVHPQCVYHGLPQCVYHGLLQCVSHGLPQCVPYRLL